MKAKHFFSLLLTLAIFMCTVTIPVLAEDPIKVIMDGTELIFDVPPQITNGRTMVPMRKIFEAFGAEVEWVEETQSIYASLSARTITLQIDHHDMHVTDSSLSDSEQSERIITLDVPPMVVNDRTLVPVRAISEALDATVTWNSDTQTVIITTKSEEADSDQIPEVEELSEELFGLMDNRLLVAMPEGTVDSPMQGSIMSAPSSNQVETRLIHEKDDEKLVLYAYELFSYSSGNLEDDAEFLADSWENQTQLSYTCSKIRNENIQAMELVPSSFHPINDAILIKSALVRTEDNMLLLVSLYANQKKFADQKHCFDLADQIFGTMKAGSRTIDPSAHHEKIWLHELDIKDGYLLTLHRGPDFDVYYITKIVVLGEDQPSMGIYIGGHPSSNVPNNVSVKKEPDTILKKQITWSSYQVNNVLRLVTVFDIPHSDFLKMHIFISAYNETELAEMRAMAQSLKSNS